MTTRYAMPTVWVALPDGSGIVEYDPTAEGHTLDLEADDDTKPLVISDWIVQILGFDPLTEPGFEDEKGETRQKLILEGTNTTVDSSFASVNKSNSQFVKSGIQRNQPNNTSLPNTGAVHVYKGGQLPAQRAWNGAPGITGSHLNEFHQAPLTQRAEYQEAIANILIDQVGYDVIGRNFELVGGIVLQTPGDYHPRGKGAYVQARVDTDDDGHVNTDTRNRLDAAEAVRGALLRQDAAGWFLPVYIEDLSPKQQNLLDISISRPLANEEVSHVRELLADEMGSDFFSPIPTAGGFRLLNVPDASGMSNVVFQRRAQAALKKANLPDMEGKPLYADDGYIQNDWKDNPHGEAYHAAIAGTGSSGVQRTANKLFTTLGPQLADLESQFKRDYGWKPDSKTRFWQKAQTGDRTRLSLDFEERKHPRGQPENKGEFAKTSGGAASTAMPRVRPPRQPVSGPVGIPVPKTFHPEVAKRVDEMFITRSGLGNSSAAYTNKVPLPVRRALRDYSDNATGAYAEINKSLRTGVPIESEKNRSILADIETWFNDPASQMPADISVFRGTQLAPELIQSMDAAHAAGESVTFYNGSLTSTSLSPHVADMYKKDPTNFVYLSITVKQGTPAAYMNGCCSEHPEEYELLLPRSVPFSMTGKKVVGGRTYYELMVGA